LQSSLGHARLGLSDADYSQIAREASVILHVAWSVNFRMRLRSFEKDNIAGELSMLFSSAVVCPCCRILSPGPWYGANSPVPMQDCAVVQQQCIA